MKQGYAALSARQYLIKSTISLIKKESKHFLKNNNISDDYVMFYMNTIKSYMEDLKEIVDIK